MNLLAKIKNDEKLKKEIPKFLIAGLSAVGSDLGIYYLLLKHLSHSYAKGISFMCGTVVAFFINKFWTFQQKRKSTSEVVRFFMLYLFTLGVNIGVNKVSLKIFPGWVFFAFLAATGCSTVLNFGGQKWWVFK